MSYTKKVATHALGVAMAEPDPTPVSEPVPTVNAAKLSRAQIVRAATNDPALSLEEFTLGERTFKILDLDYDSYIAFAELLEPLITALVSGVTSGAATGEAPRLDGISIRQVAVSCAHNLPELVKIICNQEALQQDPVQLDLLVTGAQVKAWSKKPFKLAEIVLMQVARNGMVKDFTDFFGQMLRLQAGLKM